VSPDDARQSLLSLTGAGKKPMHPRDPDKREVGAMLDRLNPPGRNAGRGDARIETMIAPAPRHRAESSCANRSPVTRLVVARHAELYAQEYGWAKISRASAPDRRRFAASTSATRTCWIAEMDGQNVGCVFWSRIPRRSRGLRLLLVDPMARGCGLGTK